MSATGDRSDTEKSASAAPPEPWVAWPALEQLMNDFAKSTGLGQQGKGSLDQSDNPVFLCVNYGRFDAEDSSHHDRVSQVGISLSNDLSPDQSQQVVSHQLGLSARIVTNSSRKNACMTRCDKKTLQESRDAFGLDSGPSVSQVGSQPSAEDGPFSSLGVLTLDDLKNLDSIAKFVVEKRTNGEAVSPEGIVAQD